MDVFTLFKRLSISRHKQFIIIFLLVLLKFLLARIILFENITVAHTIFVEAGYLLFIFGVIEFLPFNKLKSLLYLFLNLIFSMILLAVLVYHNYFGYIVTIHVFSQITQVGTIKESVLQLIEPIYLILFFDFIVFSVYLLFRKKQESTFQKPNYRFLTIALLLGFSTVVFHLSVQKDKEIANTVIAAEKQGILTYEILATRIKETSIHPSNLVEKEINKVQQEVMQIKQITPLSKEKLRLNGIAKDKNIIAIQAESFQNFAINLEVEGKEVTPFINSLLRESIYFPNTYQQIGPGNTSDAEFLFNTSAYPSAIEAASDIYGKKQIPSLPKLLRSHGYYSITFHANDVNFWNRKALYPALGFDKYYDIEFFGDNDVIGMGPSDDYAFNKIFPKIKKLYDENQKFYAQFITLSNHRPFKLPEDKPVVDLPKRFQNTMIGDYLRSLYYTDWALKNFVNKLKGANMWEDTILIFYGDHFGLQPSGLTEKDFTLFKELVGHDYIFLDQFNIPFIITLPGIGLNNINETVTGQIDMMPTVANLLDVSLDNFIHFGQDVINYSNSLFGSRYYMPPGSFFNNEIAFKPAVGFEDGEAYDLKTMSPVNNFQKYKEDYNRILNLLDFADEYMYSLPER